MVSIKKLLFLLVCFMFISSPVWATDYYVRPSGGSYGLEDGTSYANAWDGFSNINWGTVDSGNGKLFVAGTHRERLNVLAAGEDGSPIQIVSCTVANGASDNDAGIVLMSEQYDHTDWGDETPWYDNGNDNGTCEAGEVCIYRFADAALPDYIWSPSRSTNGGTTWARVPHVYHQTMRTWTMAQVKANLKDEEFYWNATNDGGDYAYFRCDYTTCGAGGENLGLWEIGTRWGGVTIGGSYHWTVVDGVTIKFGGGSDDSGYLNSHAIHNSANNVIIRNITVDSHWFWGYRNWSWDATQNITIQDNVFQDSAGGIQIGGQYIANDPGSQNNSNVLIKGNAFLRIGAIATDAGDTESIGIQAVSDLTISENYFDENLYAGVTNTGGKNQVAIVWSENVTIEHNYFYRCGLSCVSWGIGVNELSTSNLYIRHNVFDSWGYHAAADLSTCNDVHALGNENGNWVTIKENDPNDDDHGYEFEVTNNLFINGPDILGSHTNAIDDDSTFFTSSGPYYTKIEISNNIFHNNNSYAELDIWWHWDTPKAQVFIENNYFYDTSGSRVIEWNAGVGGYTWAHDEIITGASGGWDYDWVNDLNFTAGNNDNNVDANPQLISTTAGPGNDKSPAEGSPLIDAEKTVSGNNDAIDRDSNFAALPPDVITIVANEIGPYGFEGDPPDVGGPTGAYWISGSTKSLITGGPNIFTLSNQ
jgi:hypothetical protein